MRASRRSFLVTAFLLQAIVTQVQSWTTATSSPQSKHQPHQLCSPGNTNNENIVSRRNLLGILAGAGVALGIPNVAQAASSTPSASELERLQLGHARVKYLLDHWNDVTEVCGTTIMSDTERRQVIRTEGGTQCTKTPLRVQEFLGYKSTTDPLYRADKLMVRAGPLVDPDDFENYLDAVERYREKADQSALLAYTSSWGEANPNGGKEVIEDYLEQTKLQVVESERLLKQVLDYLKLPTLPPLQGKL